MQQIDSEMCLYISYNDITALHCYPSEWPYLIKYSNIDSNKLHCKCCDHHVFDDNHVFDDIVSHIYLGNLVKKFQSMPLDA